MEIELCLLVFTEDDRLVSLDKERFDRAVDHLEPLVEYAGQSIKVAGAMIDRSQVPAVMLDVFGQHVYFDEAGMVDEEKLSQSVRFNDKVVEEGYHNDFIWTPNPDERRRIEAALC